LLVLYNFYLRNWLLSFNAISRKIC